MCTQADPVDSRRGENIDLGLIQRSWIRFDGPLASWRQVKPAPDHVHQVAQLERVEAGRSSPSHEDRVNLLGLLDE